MKRPTSFLFSWNYIFLNQRKRAFGPQVKFSNGQFLPLPSTSWLKGKWEVGTAIFNVALGATSALTAFLIIFLKGNLIDVGAFFTVFSGVSVPSLFFWGKLSDKYADRGDLLAVSYAFSGISLLVMAISNNLYLLFLAGSSLSFFSSAMAPVTSMMAVEEVPEYLWNKRVGIVNAYINYGYGLGLLLDVAFVGYQGAKNAFILASALCMIGGFLVYESMKQITLRKIERQSFHKIKVARSGILERHGLHNTIIFHLPSLKLIIKMLKQKNERLALLVILSASLFVAASSLAWTPIPIFIERIVVDERLVFVLMFMNSFATALFFELEGKRVSFDREEKVYVESLGLRAFIYLAYIAAIFFSPLKFLILVFSLSLSGMIWSTYSLSLTGLLAKSTTTENRGTAFGTLNSMTGLASLLASYASGWVASALGFSALFLFATIVTLAAFITGYSMKWYGKS